MRRKIGSPEGGKKHKVQNKEEYKKGLESGQRGKEVSVSSAWKGLMNIEGCLSLTWL
jgi:hypothetical protein